MAGLAAAGDAYQLLNEAFRQYAESLQCPADLCKAKQTHLSSQLQTEGVHGANALQLLAQHGERINWHGMHPELFSVFYRFVFFLCREPGKRNVQAKTAVSAWLLLLRGRFRLLERFCDYVAASTKAVVVTEDTWRQVLDFSRTVHEDLANYDPSAAWPVLLDDFVEACRGAGGGGAASGRRASAEPMELLLNPLADRTLTAVSPRSGSKRRMPDLLDVVDALQQLPLGSTGTAASSGGSDGSGSDGGTATAAHAFAGGAFSAVSMTAEQLGGRAPAKRYRASSAGPQSAPAAARAAGGAQQAAVAAAQQPRLLAAPVVGSGGGRGSEAAGDDDAIMGSPGVPAAAAIAAGGRAAGVGGSSSGGGGCVSMQLKSPWSQPMQQHHQQQHGISSSSSGAFMGSSTLSIRAPRVACGGAWDGSDGGGIVDSAPRQQASCSGGGLFGGGAGGGGGGFTLPPCCPTLAGAPGAGRGFHSNNGPTQPAGQQFPQQQQQQQHLAQAGAFLGPSPHHVSGSSGNSRHSSVVNGMMHVTVTEALGFN